MTTLDDHFHEKSSQEVYVPACNLRDAGDGFEGELSLNFGSLIDGRVQVVYMRHVLRNSRGDKDGKWRWSTEKVNGD
jgi:hypothetical protein